MCKCEGQDSVCAVCTACVEGCAVWGLLIVSQWNAWGFSGVLRTLLTSNSVNIPEQMKNMLTSTACSV